MLFRASSSLVSRFAIALAFTLLNVPKPLLIDDAAYYYYARQIAHDPLRPYDFSMFWYQYPHPANEILAPPGLPYWWAIAYKLFGEQPGLWKLWLLPYSVLFVFTMHALFRRFARGLEMPLLLLTVFSPTFLPSLNLMLDVPALALGLSAITVFFRACARRSFGLALAAGLLAGLGMETKYTGFLAPCVIALYALLFRRLLLGMVAVLVAALLFCGWESFIFYYHGESHFLLNVRGHVSHWGKRDLAGSLLTIIGGLSPPLILLGLAALRTPWWLLLPAGGLFGLGYGFIAFYDGPGLEATSGLLRVLAEPHTHVDIESVVFSSFGLLAVCVMGGVLALLFWRLLVAEPPNWLSPFLRVDVFLLCWLLGETVAYFYLTPFPAVRRVLGVMVVSTLLGGRLAARSCRSSQRRRVVIGVTGFGVLLGFGFYSVDMLDARASQKLAEDAALVIRGQDDHARIWYVGHWGFQFYAEQAGMMPVVPERSQLKAGDWLVVPEPRLNQQTIHIEEENTAEAERIAVLDHIPFRTVQCFYGGRVPLEHHQGPRARVTIYRVTAPFIPESKGD